MPGTLLGQSDTRDHATKDNQPGRDLGGTGLGMRRLNKGQGRAVLSCFGKSHHNKGDRRAWEK